MTAQVRYIPVSALGPLLGLSGPGAWRRVKRGEYGEVTHIGRNDCVRADIIEKEIGSVTDVQIAAALKVHRAKAVRQYHSAKTSSTLKIEVTHVRKSRRTAQAEEWLEQYANNRSAK